MPDLYAVFAVTADDSRHRISPAQSYDVAHVTFAYHDQNFKTYCDAGKPVRVAGSQVEYFSIRSMDDEHWNTKRNVEGSEAEVVLGWQAIDYAPGGAQWHVTRTVKLSEVQQEVMGAAAETGHISFDTHQKTCSKLRDLGLIKYNLKGSDLTPLGQAIADRAYHYIHGATVAEMNAIRQRENEERARQREARKADVIARAESLALKLTDLTIDGESAANALLNDKYETPVFCARRHDSDSKGYYKVSLDELEAIVEALSA